MKMRTRLMLTALVLLSVGFYGLAEWIVRDVRLHYFITMEESLVDTSVMLAEQISRQVDGEVIRLDPEFKASFTAAADRSLDARIYEHVKTRMNLRVLVVDRSHRVLYDSRGKISEGEKYLWRDTRLALRDEYGARASYEIPGDQDSFYFYVAAPVKKDGRIVGAVTVGKPVSSIAPFMRQARKRLIGSSLVAFAAILLLLLPVSLWIIQPVRALTHYARAIRDGRKAERPVLGHGGEMSELANAFEEMRDALEGKQYVEEYVQSLTHEMKSPLAAIRGAVELLNEEMTAEQRERFLSNIGMESERLHELVDRMLSLAALEKRKELARIEVFDAEVLIEDAVDSLLTIAGAREVAVETTVPEGLQLRGEYFLLRQAVLNLLQNAVGFSPEGGQVDVLVQKAGGQVSIAVRDEGPGIPDYARARIFDRFYSLPRPGSRSKSTGLGLNFVREIAALHGGSIKLETRPEGGVCAILKLPAMA